METWATWRVLVQAAKLFRNRYLNLAGHSNNSVGSSSSSNPGSSSSSSSRGVGPMRLVLRWKVLDKSPSCTRPFCPEEEEGNVAFSMLLHVWLT